MFYSETLLAKTGPLARVWLAANLERKLTKQNVLTSNLEDNVKSIIAPGQAPMALRLSGQLLLGVVKIYSRKAAYLFDDCHDVLNKIKSAFRPGNVDLPATHTTNPTALILPDAVTELDLFAPLPDPDELLRGNDLADARRGIAGKDPTLLDFGTSQLLSSTQNTPRKIRQTRELEDLDLELDFGLDGADERSVEIGRRDTGALRDEPTLLVDEDLGLDFGFGEDTTMGGQAGMIDDDMPMLLDDNDNIAASNAAALANAELTAEKRARDSASPLSELRPSAERDLEFQFNGTTTLNTTSSEEADPTVVQAAQRIKRRKVMPQDTETQLKNSQIKAQQEDRAAITREPQFLPRDPALLQLMEMQRNGSFVSHIMGDGRLRGWAPELRGILSLEVVRLAGEKKRKRDSGVADLKDADQAGQRAVTPRVEIPQDEEDEGVQLGAGAADFAFFDGLAPPLHSDGLGPLLHDETLTSAISDHDPAFPAFETTEAPLLHPSNAGPISLATQTAVTLLRTHLAPSHPTTATEPPTPSKRLKSEALFTDLCPEARTTRQDATKMFFELLVLGTRDAVKVEQEAKGELGGPIRVRGKRGLWGSWAEGEGEGVGGEVAEEALVV